MGSHRKWLGGDQSLISENWLVGLDDWQLYSIYVLSSPFSQFRMYPQGAKTMVGKLQTSDSGSAAEWKHILSWYLPYQDIPKCIVEGDISQNALQQGKMYLKSKEIKFEKLFTFIIHFSWSYCVWFNTAWHSKEKTAWDSTNIILPIIPCYGKCGLCGSCRKIVDNFIWT